jgi:hypothetical protein
MSFQTVCSTLSRSDGLVMVKQIAVIVGSKIQFHELGQLTNSRRHVSIETEAADVHQSYTSVGVERDTRLVSPKIRILVEVPVTSRRIVLTYISLLRTMKRLPDLVESIIVLDIFIRLVEFHRNVSISGLVVCNLELSSNTVVDLDKAPVLVIDLIRFYGVLSCSQRKKRITLK